MRKREREGEKKKIILKMIVELKSSRLSCDKKMNQCCELAPQVES